MKNEQQRLEDVSRFDDKLAELIRQDRGKHFERARFSKQTGIELDFPRSNQAEVEEFYLEPVPLSELLGSFHGIDEDDS